MSTSKKKKNTKSKTKKKVNKSSNIKSSDLNKEKVSMQKDPKPKVDKNNIDKKGVEKKATSEKTTLEKIETNESKSENKEILNAQTTENVAKKKRGRPKKVKTEVIDEEKENKKLENAEKLDKKQEAKQDGESIKSEENKDIIKAPQKDIAQNGEKPEYVQEMIKKRKIRTALMLIIIFLIILLIFISTIFAITNTKNKNIISGISVKNIDISNLSKEDSIKKISEAMNKELIAEIDLNYGEEYSVTLKPEQIEFKYEIESTIENAYSIGREGNVLLDNYSIIFAKLLGREIKIGYSYNGDLLNQFVQDINSKLPGVLIEPTYYIEDDMLVVSKGTDGISVKSEELKNQIIQAILERRAAKMTDGFSQKIEIPVEYAKTPEIDMKKIYSEIYTEPKDAYFETEPYKIYPDVDGIDLKISVDEAQKIIDAENKEEYSFELKITEAEKTIDELGTEAFPYLISQFTTKYDASNRNRSTNLKIAAEKINGKVLMPGEEFSFNKIVGKRTVEEGYRDAKIYADGGVVDGLAGGICQISSTLYNSVLLANLQITERRNHSFTTSYLPAGKDATVVWGTTDFRFINSRSYPIKIEASVNNGIAEFKIHGMQEETEYEVRILPVRTQSIPFATTYEEDQAVLPGQQIVKQAGHSGCKVTTYKELRLNGEVISKEVISNDTYQPMRKIIRVAPGGIPVTQ